MTFIARELLRRVVIRVTETDAIRRRLFRSANKTAELMTRAARSDVAAVDLRRRRVTTETCDVRVCSRRNRQANAVTVSSMATVASRAEGGVSRMIEFDVEAPQRWKRFHLSALRIRVTDRADLARLIRELLRVTSAARSVRVLARQRRRRRVVYPTMAQQTRQPRVIFVVVFELRVIRLRRTALKADQAKENTKTKHSFPAKAQRRK